MERHLEQLKEWRRSLNFFEPPAGKRCRLDDAVQKYQGPDEKYDRLRSPEGLTGSLALISAAPRVLPLTESIRNELAAEFHGTGRCKISRTMAGIANPAMTGRSVDPDARCSQAGGFCVLDRPGPG